MIATTLQLVRIVNEYQLWAPSPRELRLIHRRERCDYYLIVELRSPRCGAIERNHAASSLALDWVCRETFAGVDVPDIDSLILDKTGSVCARHEHHVDRPSTAPGFMNGSSLAVGDWTVSASSAPKAEAASAICAPTAVYALSGKLAQATAPLWIVTL